MPVTVSVIDAPATQATLDAVFACFTWLTREFSTYKRAVKSLINQKALVAAASADAPSLRSLKRPKRSQWLF